MNDSPRQDPPFRDFYETLPPWVRRMAEMAGELDPTGAPFAPGRGHPVGPATDRQRPGGPGWGPDPFTGFFARGIGAALAEAFGVDPGTWGSRPEDRGSRSPWGAGRQRANRGDVRAAILELLAESPMHGYQLMQEMSERSGGAWRPSPGSVYPTLAQLEDEGLVDGHKEGGRRVFSLTEAGRAAAEATDADAPWEAMVDRAEEQFEQAEPSREAHHEAPPEGPSPDEDDAGVRSLREEAAATAGAVMAVATSGDPASVERAREILSETRRRLYRLLAEETDAA